MPKVLPGTSKVLVFVVPETYLSVYSHLHSDLYLGFCRYEGIRVKRVFWMFCYIEHVGPGCPVCDYDVGPGYLMFCPEPSRFYLFTVPEICLSAY